MSRSATGRIAATVSALALAAGVLSTVTPATAAPAPEPRVLASGLLSPLSVAVSPGHVYFSQNFAGQLMHKRPGRKPRTVFTARRQGTEVGAVSVRRHRVLFATTETDGDTYLKKLRRGGKARALADLSDFEERRNPDRHVTYGVRGLDEECAAQFPEEVPASYTGIVESHPYATYQTRRRIYVADAAANAILRVNRWGRVRTVAVLPGAPLKITPELAGQFGIPECAHGMRYWFESVPTDVELGRDGKLYVTSLPGGPEDPSLGARGSVFRVNPWTGRVRRIVTGLVSPTGIAVGHRGRLFVAELFGGRIAKVRPGGRVRTFARVPLPGDVESTRWALFATGNVLPGEGAPAGTVLRWRR